MASTGQVEEMTEGDDACRPLLLSMFSVLKELYVHCGHNRAAMACQQQPHAIVAIRSRSSTFE